MFLNWLETTSTQKAVSSKAKRRFKSLSILHFKNIIAHVNGYGKVLPFFIENGLFFMDCRPSLKVNHVTKSRDLLSA